MAGDHEAVAAVVAFAAADRDGAGDAQGQEQVRRVAAGVFHEDDAGDAEFLDGSAVDVANLVTGEVSGGHGGFLAIDPVACDVRPSPPTPLLGGERGERANHRLMRRLPLFTRLSTSSRVIQAKSPGIECLMALAATP